MVRFHVADSMVQWWFGVTLDWTSHLIQFLTIGVTIEFSGYSGWRIGIFPFKPLPYLHLTTLFQLHISYCNCIKYEDESELWTRENVEGSVRACILSFFIAWSDWERLQKSDLRPGNQTHGLPDKRIGVIGTLRYELSRHTIRRLKFKSIFYAYVLSS